MLQHIPQTEDDMDTCNWGFSSDTMKSFHDEERGVPLHDDRKQFEFLMMESMQCGISWDLMIKTGDIQNML